MSSKVNGRHRAKSRMSAKPFVRAGATVALTSGLVLSNSGASSADQVLPAKPMPTSAAVPAAVTQAAAVSNSVKASTRILPTVSSYVTMRWGSRGNSVATIQKIVGTNPDGVFGPITHSAVRDYQANKGLKVDGIVGPQTSAAMGLSRGSTSASRSGSRSASSIISNAQSLLGTFYRWGGSTYSGGYDCSGYVNAVFAKSGISLPRTAASIQAASTSVTSPRAGDLVFYDYPATHVAIYAGDGMIYDSGRSNGTSKRKMFSGNISYGRIG